MKNVLLSTAYLPPVDYLAVLIRAEHVIIDTQEHYRKQSWRNRARILSANGPLNLSVPVLHSGNKTPVDQAGIDYSRRWQQIHWRALEAAYGSSPYFIHYAGKFKNILFSGEPLLVRLNSHMLDLILSLMKLNVSVNFNSMREYREDDYYDLRDNIHPKKAALIAPAPYQQVFGDRFGFTSGLSSADLLFNLGPRSADYLYSCVLQD